MGRAIRCLTFGPVPGLLLLGCGGGADVGGPKEQPSPRPPVVSSFAVSPAGGTAPLEVALSLTCADPDGSIVEYRVDFEDDGVDDLIQSSPVSGQAHTYEEASTARGKCKDDDGFVATDTVRIEVNRPPEVSIEAPPDSSIFSTGEEVTLRGSGEDPEDGSLTGGQLTWESQRDGTLGSGSEIVTTLTAGDHIVTLTGADSDSATASASITLTVEASNEAPSVSISSPAQDTTVAEGDPVTFEGVADDPEDGSLTGGSLSWTSSRDGDLGTGETVTVSDLSVGDHTVTLRATDSEGATEAARVGVSVEEASGGGSAAPSIQSVSPDPLVDGGSATIVGEGFDPAASGNRVLVGGVEATVTSASTTELDVTVPDYDCRPRRSAGVQVVVGSDSSNVVGVTVNPDEAALALAPGERLVVQDPSDGFCLQFDESTATEEYLVGAQSVTRTLGLTGVILSAETGTGSSGSGSVSSPGGAAAAAAGRRGPAGPGRRLRVPEAWGRHYRAESRLRAWEDAHLRALMDESLPRGPGGRPVAPSHGSSLPGTVSEGDTVELRVPRIHETDLCSEYDSIQGVVRKIGAHGIWVEDPANPDSGYVAGDWTELSDAFDDLVFPTDTEYFGEPTDVDGNDRVVMVVSKAVNEAGGVLGFVFGGDLASRSSCASSDEGEVTYLVAPDPHGLHGPERAVEDLKRDNPRLVAHEFTHMIQFGVRSSCTGCSFMPAFVSEGQATLAEELNGHAETGRSPGNDYGASVAFSDTPRPWYDNRFVDLAFYYGYGGRGTHFETAPEECSWLVRDWAGVCGGTRGVYGVPSTIMRWMADHFGPGYPGGEKGFFRDMTANTATGFANWEDLTGLSVEEILARWGPMLWLDGRVQGVDLMLTLPSWDLADVFASVVPEARLQPHLRSFAAFSDTLSVNAGSAAYYLIGDSSRPSTAVKARAPGGGPLPAFMQIWVVRAR